MHRHLVDIFWTDHGIATDGVGAPDAADGRTYVTRERLGRGAHGRTPIVDRRRSPARRFPVARTAGVVSVRVVCVSRDDVPPGPCSTLVPDPSAVTVLVGGCAILRRCADPGDTTPGTLGAGSTPTVGLRWPDPSSATDRVVVIMVCHGFRSHRGATAVRAPECEVRSPAEGSPADRRAPPYRGPRDGCAERGYPGSFGAEHRHRLLLSSCARESVSTSGPGRAGVDPAGPGARDVPVTLRPALASYALRGSDPEPVRGTALLGTKGGGSCDVLRVCSRRAGDRPPRVDRIDRRRTGSRGGRAGGHRDRGHRAARATTSCRGRPRGATARR